MFWIIQTKKQLEKKCEPQNNRDNRQPDIFCQGAHANLQQISVNRPKQSDNHCMFLTNLSLQKQKSQVCGSTNELAGEQPEPRGQRPEARRLARITSPYLSFEFRKCCSSWPVYAFEKLAPHHCTLLANCFLQRKQEVAGLLFPP